MVENWVFVSCPTDLDQVVFDFPLWFFAQSNRNMISINKLVEVKKLVKWHSDHTQESFFCGIFSVPLFPV
jgi:hypothetical protein